MNAQLNIIQAQQRQEQIRQAATGRVKRPANSVDRAAPESDLVVRLAGPGDAGDLRRLAELEGLPVPAGDVLVAFPRAGGQALAALPVGSGAALADPFRPTAGAVGTLREARAHLRGERPRGRGRRIGAALGKLFSPSPSTGSRAPAVPGGEGRLIR